MFLLIVSKNLPNSISVVPPTKRQDEVYEWNLVPNSKNPVVIPPKELIDFIQEKTNKTKTKPILFKTFKTKNYASRGWFILIYHERADGTASGGGKPPGGCP